MGERWPSGLQVKQLSAIWQWHHYISSVLTLLLIFSLCSLFLGGMEGGDGVVLSLTRGVFTWNPSPKAPPTLRGTPLASSHPLLT